ncbi:MAG TPA: RIP metalloprotease RseP, partial [Blastocatellia bacterium]|nr:RIP metalloprotease RseP [Blastocatellia bacterium]
GHFIVAKFFGIRVDVFSVGFGKRLFGFKRGDTDYRLSLIPLGGYVKMAGENLDEQVTGAPDEFQSKPKWQRLCVAFAGPTMNVLTALAIPAILAMIHYEVPAYTNQPPVVNAVAAGSAAEKAGLQRGDLILSIEGQQNPTWRDVEDYIAINPDHDVPVTIKRGDEVRQLILPVASQKYEQEVIGEAGLEPYFGPDTRLVTRAVSSGSPGEEAGLKTGDEIVAVNGKPVEPGVSPNADAAAAGNSNGEVLHGSLDVIREIQKTGEQPVTLAVKRGEETLNITATPRMDAGKPRIGFLPGLAGGEMIITRLSPVAALKHSVDMNMRILQLTKTALAQVFVGQRSARDTITGPVGIAQIVGQAAEQGATPVFQLMGILSLNLGIFNLLPIPVLDGGLIFMILLEAFLGLFGLPLTLRIKEKMMQVGFVMLMLLMGFVIFNDISKRFVSRSSSPQQVEQPKPSNK